MHKLCRLRIHDTTRRNYVLLFFILISLCSKQVLRCLPRLCMWSWIIYYFVMMALHGNLHNVFISFSFCGTSCQLCALRGCVLHRLEKDRSCSEVSFSALLPQCASHHLQRVLFCFPELALYSHIFETLIASSVDTMNDYFGRQIGVGVMVTEK